MSDFEWRTDEDRDWDDSPIQDNRNRPPQTGRNWLLLAVGLLGLLVAGFFVYRQVTGRVTAATAATEDDVRSSFNLVYASAANGDRELFSTLLSGRDRNWTASQQLLVGSGDLFGRDVWGMQWQKQPADVTDVTLSADLRSAELTARVPYTIDIGNGLTNTVTLLQEATYRRGEDRWLYAPPEDDYWGDANGQMSGQFVLATFPERDSALVTRIVEAIDPLVGELCGQSVVNPCGQMRLTIDFSTNPALMIDPHPLNLGDPQYLSLTLPTPSLVGKPANEDAYRALLRGYARQIIYPLLAHLGNYPCCSHAGVFQALADTYLRDKGLVAWPVTKQDYLAWEASGLRLTESVTGWQISDVRDLSAENRLLSYALVDFVLQNGQSTDLTRRISFLTAGTRSLSSWLALALDGRPMPLGNIDDAWQEFVSSRAYTAAPPPIPLPQQDIVATCSNTQFDTISSGLYRYRFSDDAWEPLYGPTDRYLGFLALSAEPNELIITERDYVSDASILTAWRPDGVQTLVEGDLGNELLYWGQRSPDGQYLFVLNFGDSESGSQPYLMLDRRQCSGAQCPLAELAGIPTWSPDGRHTIIASFPEPTDFVPGTIPMPAPIYIGDAAGNPIRQVANLSIDTRFNVLAAPVWLDNEQFLILTDDPLSSNSAQRRLALASVTNEQMTTLLDAGTVRALIPDDDPNDIVVINSILGDPTRPDHVFLALGPPLDMLGEENVTTYIVDFNWKTQQADYVRPQTGVIGFGIFLFTFEPSQDGRFLTVSAIDNGWSLQLYDTQTDTMIPAGRSFQPDVAWSDDGQWILSTSETYLSVSAPAYGYETRVFTAPRQCSFVHWLTP